MDDINIEAVAVMILIVIFIFCSIKLLPDLFAMSAALH